MNDKHVLRGSCACSNISVTFSTIVDPLELAVRSCLCSFCTRHAAVYASDPKGRARFFVADEAALVTYRFATRSADFLLCGRCGVYVGAHMDEGDRSFAVVNLRGIGVDVTSRKLTQVSYDSESAELRKDRRVSRWTPAEWWIARRVRSDSAAARELLAAYVAELAALFDFDPNASVSAEPDEMAGERGTFLIILERGLPIACGGVKAHAPGVAEIKRMYVAPEARRGGVGRDLLAALELAARGLGFERVVLDTAAPLDAATALYRSAGYTEVPAFNANPYAARWFSKELE